MKSTVKILISVLALGMAAASPLLRAEDENAPPAETPKEGGRRGRDGGRGGMMVEERIATIEKAVGTLTDDQKAAMKGIYAKAQEEMQALRGGGDRQAARGKLQEIGKSTHEQIKALLTTDEQKKKFDEMPEPGRGGRGGKGGKKKEP